MAKGFAKASKEWNGRGKDGNMSGGSVGGRHRKNQAPDQSKGGSGKRGIGYMITGRESKGK